MMLEGDERSQLRGPAAAADLNNDNVITVEELVARLSNRESTNRESSERVPRDRGDRDKDAVSDRGSSTSSTTNKTRVFTGSAGGSGSGKEKADKRRSYRFTPPTERLGTDLPSWFKSRDRNEDGQVAMSEYSRTWSERMVREFQRYDLNNDGVITPKEALR
jgi:Ca2+-binding EF-hand superfamily protein